MILALVSICCFIAWVIILDKEFYKEPKEKKILLYAMTTWISVATLLLLTQEILKMIRDSQ